MDREARANRARCARRHVLFSPPYARIEADLVSRSLISFSPDLQEGVFALAGSSSIAAIFARPVAIPTPMPYSDAAGTVHRYWTPAGIPV